ncbi:MAG: DUF3611 family protein [Synechococcales cyanobacterium RU_4_20]|nr:DUF3611 family protein [Synechococcales cyanobacterium RU_4_20]
MLDSTSPAPVHKIASEFRRLGWASFWFQTVLGVVATGMLLLGAAGLGNTAGAGGGLLFAVAGLIALGVGSYRAFRNARMGRQLGVADKAVRPSRAETLTLLRKSIMANMIGLVLIILGAEAFSGALFFKAASLGFGGLGLLSADPGKLIQLVDIFVVLANTHIIAAHFFGLATALWLVNRVAR